MLRYFYIAICIPIGFCYAYIYKNHHEYEKRSKYSGSSENVKDHGSNKMVRFDVASFIRNTVTEKSPYYEPYFSRNKKQNDALTQSEDYYYTQMNENEKERNEDVDNLNTDIGPIENNLKYISSLDADVIQTNSKDSFGENEGNLLNSEDKSKKDEVNELLIDKNLIQNPEKKCAFKDMKMPFFSRKKPSRAKSQNQKLHCFICADTYNEATEINDQLKELRGKIKRAYGNLCPKCIKELLRKRQKGIKAKNKTIHNSRDFIKTTTLSVENKRPKLEDNNYFEDLYFSDYVRAKRHEADDRERQLKELAEVEKKVDHEHVTTPKYTKVPLYRKND